MSPHLEPGQVGVTPGTPPVQPLPPQEPAQFSIANAWISPGHPPPPPPTHLPAHPQRPNIYGSISPAASSSLTSVISVQPPPTSRYYSAIMTTPNNAVPLIPTRILVIGQACPHCRIGALLDDFDCFAIFLAILFFPLGIFCCLAMRRRRCTNCGVIF